MRLGVAVVAMCLVIVGVSAAQNASAAINRKPTNIPAQPLASALEAFAKQRDLQVIYRSDLVKSVYSTGAVGLFTPEEALGKLLNGTGLIYRYLNESTVTITLAPGTSSETAPASEPPTSGSSTPGDRPQRGGGTVWDRLLLAQAGQDTQQKGSEIPSAAAGSRPAAVTSEALEEVTVTANRRSETVLNYAGSVDVLNGETLDNPVKTGFEGYLLRVPSVSLREENGVSHITVRGVSNISGGDYGSAATSETVGVYINDVPLAGTSVLPDLGLYDVQRVEVLKGPQGTLYGAGSMGGAIRILLNEPTTDAATGSAEVTGSYTEHGGGNYLVRGAVNVPVSTSVAVRIAASDKHDSGFIDNVATGEKDANPYDERSVRALLKAQVLPNLTAEVLLLNESSKQFQANDADNIAALTVNSPEPRFNDSNTSLFALTLAYDLGFADLTSVSSGFRGVRHRLNHLVLGSSLAGIYGVPVTQDNFRFEADVHSFSQEIRAVSKDTGPFEWILGAYYQNLRHDVTGGTDLDPADLVALNTVLFQQGLPIFGTPEVWNTTTIKDYSKQGSLYADLTYHFSDTFDAFGGIRGYYEHLYSYQYQHGDGVFSGIVSGPVLIKPNDSGFVPRVGVRYFRYPKLMTYASVSQGYRSSAPNLGFNNFGLGSPGVHPDKATTYELGAKAESADNRIALNAAIYHIRWTRIQLAQTAIAVKAPYIGLAEGFLSNAGDATINGAELSLEAAPVRALNLGASIGYNESKLTSALVPSFVGVELPVTPKWTASGWTTYRTALSGKLDGEIGLDAEYVGRQLAVLPSAAAVAGTANADGAPISPYFSLNLRTGLSAQDWRVSLFVENLTDRRSEVGRGLLDSTGAINDPNRYSIIRPRTVGLTVGYSF